MKELFGLRIEHQVEISQSICKSMIPPSCPIHRLHIQSPDRRCQEAANKGDVGVPASWEALESDKQVKKWSEVIFSHHTPINAKMAHPLRI